MTGYDAAYLELAPRKQMPLASLTRTGRRSSELKIEANRANAQASTGPRTEPSEARSSQNARKHGLTAQATGGLCEINPSGQIEQTLFDELVAAAWNLRRILESELDLLDPQYDRLTRHKTRNERTFHRALKELKALQTNDTLNRMLPGEILHKTPLLASPLIIAKRSHERRREIPAGFPHSLPALAQAPFSIKNESFVVDKTFGCTRL